MKVVVYTCVFGGYDRVFPPVRPEAGIDYVILTDDPGCRVHGWRSVVMAPAVCDSRKAPNRRLKMLGHAALGSPDVSFYVDGNVRVIGGLTELADGFLRTGAALGVYRHPLRLSVREEVQACVQAGKVSDASAASVEYEQYVSCGFPDDSGLAETGVLLKRHGAPGLDTAMARWWSLFERFDSRDQFSLPFVAWECGIAVEWLPGDIRHGPHFGLYPHLQSRDSSSRYAYVAARSLDNRAYSLLLRAWHAKWALQRRLRRRTARR